MMSIPERQAWFILGVFGLTLIAYLVLAAIIGFRLPAFGAFGLSSLAGFAPLIGLKERRQGKVVIDERDLAIQKATSIAGFATFYFFFVIICMVPLFINGPKGTITIPVTLPGMFIPLGMMILFTVHSLVVVVMHREGNHEQTD